MPRRPGISFLLVTAAVAVVGLAAACSASSDAASSPAAARRAELDRIADRCGLPRSALRAAADGYLHFQPHPDSRYETVDCAMTELRNSSLVGSMPLGFVGNEAPGLEDGNAQAH